MNIVKAWHANVATLAQLSALLLTGLAANTSYAQFTVPVTVPTAGQTGNDLLCQPLTGCLNIDIYQQIFDKTLFAGLPEMTITQIAFRPHPGEPFSSSTIADAEIRLGTTSKLVDGLSATFADNFDPGTAKIVYDTDFDGLPLVIEDDGGDDDFSVVIEFQPPYFVYTPADDGNLYFEFKNLSGDGRGAGTQFLDAEAAEGDAISSAWFVPNSTNGSGPSTANAQTANVLSTTGLVAQFTVEVDDLSNLTNIYAPQGNGVKVVNSPNFKKTATTVLLGGSSDVRICLTRDPREIFRNGQFRRYAGGYQPWRELIRMAGECDWLDFSQMRFTPEQRGFIGDLNDVPGVYIAVVNHDSRDLIFQGPLSITSDEGAVSLTEFFGVDYSNYTVPGCDAAIEQRSLIFGGENEGPNTNARSVSAQCNDRSGIVRRTDTADPMRQEITANDDRYTVEQLINTLDSIVNDAGACVDATALPAIGIIQSRSQSLHNAFVQGDNDTAYKTAENIAYHSEVTAMNFSGCPAAENFRGAVTSIATTIGFTIFDRHLHRDTYVCYIPKIRDDSDVVTVLPGFGDCIP